MNHLLTPVRWRRVIMVGAMAGGLAISGGAMPASADPTGPSAGGPSASVADHGPVGFAPAPDGLQGVSGMPGTGLAGGGEIDDHAVKGRPVEGGAGIEQIVCCAPDDRTRVDPTTTFPVSAIVQLVRNNGTSTFGCSGWMIGPSIVATAGHCVHPGGGQNGGGGNGFYPREHFEIIPGRNFPSRPYGTCLATQLLSVTGWTQDGNREYDYGAIRLDCTAGNSTGWWGFWWQGATLTGTATTVSGYPCDRTFGEQWRHAGKTVVTTQDRRIFYENDTAPCQSGSPVYQNRASGSAFCAGWCTMGIHTTGGTTANGGTRITESVFNNLIAWRGF
jgi:glutamyl endopeptidase